jgi:DNA-binding NarL/FixJ family response regulator
MKVRVLLVDDHEMLRRGLRTLIAQQANFDLVGEASTGEEALEQALTTKPDVIFMDLHLPDINGIEVSRKILSEHHSAKIIIFSSDVSRALTEEALQAGICGYILKSSASEEIVHAVISVTRGKLYISPDVSAKIMKGPNGLNLPLTDRDRQLLRMIAEGQRNKEIASTLDLSVKSVEAVRSRLMKKLDCSSSAELIRYAIREGIVPL